MQAEELLACELKALREEIGELREAGAFWETVALEGCQAITQARLRWIRGTLEAIGEG